MTCSPVSTVALEDLPSRTRQEPEGVDLVTVTASSVVRAFHRLTHDLLPPGMTPLALGPITAQTARELGYERVGVAPEAAWTRWCRPWRDAGMKSRGI